MIIKKIGVKDWYPFVKSEKLQGTEPITSQHNESQSSLKNCITLVEKHGLEGVINLKFCVKEAVFKLKKLKSIVTKEIAVTLAIEILNLQKRNIDPQRWLENEWAGRWSVGVNSNTIADVYNFTEIQLGQLSEELKSQKILKSSRDLLAAD